MNMWITYRIIAVILVVAELIYFRIADKCNIIDKPNERSSHSTIVQGLIRYWLHLLDELIL